MDLDKARHLVALADHGTFNKAAASVHLTQPAFSRSIRSLERELGVQLVDRGARQSRLTPFGEIVVERARVLLRGVRDTHRMIDALKAGAAGEIAIGLGASAAAVVLAPFLREIAAQGPTVRVRIESCTTPRLLEGLRAEQLDVVIGPYRDFAADPLLDVALIGETRAGVFVRPGHPLATAEVLDADALAAFPVFAPGLAAHVAPLLVEHLGAAGHPDRLVTLQCDDVTALAAVTARSDAVLFAMRVGVREAVQEGALVPLAVDGIDRIDFRLGIARLRDRTLPPALERFEMLARRCYADD